MDELTIILSVILLFVAVAALTDLFPLVSRWIARIHIGRWTSREGWQSAAEKVLLRQLKNTPRVPLSDQTRATFIERFKGDYSSKALQQWQQAALLLGANGLHEGEETKKCIEKFMTTQISLEGDWQRFEPVPETAMLAFAILSSRAVDNEKIRPAMDKTAEMLFALAKQSGTVPYNENFPDVRFVDTVGMICPFLTKYAFEYDCLRALKLAKEQIEEFAALGLHKKFSLPVHCFNRTTGAPLGIYGWGRGCGWWAVGLMDTYLTLTEKDIPPDSKIFQSDEVIIMLEEFKTSLLHQMTSFAKTLVTLQMANGAWDRQVFLMTSGESSATAMLAWFMKEMYRVNRKQSYLRSYEKALEYLMSATRRRGMVDYAQGDTKGIGFYSTRLDGMPAAQGFTVRCFMRQEE